MVAAYIDKLCWVGRDLRVWRAKEGLPGALGLAAMLLNAGAGAAQGPGTYYAAGPPWREQGGDEERGR